MPINHGLGSAVGVNGSSAAGEQNFTKVFPVAVKGRSPHLQARGKCKSSPVFRQNLLGMFFLQPGL